MALLYMDGFDTYKGASENTAVTDWVGRWDAYYNEANSLPAQIDFANRATGVGGSVRNNHQSYWWALEKRFMMTGNVFIAQFAHRYDSSTGFNDMLNLYNGTALVGRFRFSAGFLEYLNAAGTVLLRSTTQIPSAVFRHVGIKIDFGTGAITFYHEGVPDGTGTGLAVGATLPNMFRIGYGYAAANTMSGNAQTFRFFDDLVVMDGSGTKHNDYLGAMVVRGVNPNSDVAGTGTPTGTTTRWDAVDDPKPDEDATFVTMNMGTTDLYGIPSTAVPANVSAIGVAFRARRDGADPTNMAGAVRNGAGVLANAPAQLLSGSYETRLSIHADAPGGGNWTQAEARAAAYGVTTS